MNYKYDKYHIPAGVRDIFGDACEFKKETGKKVSEVMKGYGFQSIQTPGFEYFDIFNDSKGTLKSNEMFKFTDRNNDTLVLRGDMTPPIARCVAKYFKDEDLQIRLCYEAQTFRSIANYKGKLQEETQLGAELFQDDSSDADAEMIALTIECLKAGGLKEFQVEAGHSCLFPGLAQEAELSADEIKELKSLIESKNFFGVEKFFDGKNLNDNIKKIFMLLPESFRNLSETLNYIKENVKNEKALKAVDRLEKLDNILELYGLKDYVTIDLSAIQPYDYYTGIIFRAYTYGNGEAIASGGRYDNLVSEFGYDAAAIGMAIRLDQLMIALERQEINDYQSIPAVLLLYPKELREKAIKKANELRVQGKRVQLMRKVSKRPLSDYEKYAERHNDGQLIYIQ